MCVYVCVWGGKIFKAAGCKRKTGFYSHL